MTKKDKPKVTATNSAIMLKQLSTLIHKSGIGKCGQDNQGCKDNIAETWHEKESPVIKKFQLLEITNNNISKVSQPDKNPSKMRKT